jgi:hypothetical protein
MKVQGKVGKQTLANGAESDLRLNKSGSTVVAQGKSPYSEGVLAGDIYIGANLGGTVVTTQAGLSATTPALTLYNPVNSGVNLVLINVSIGINASPAAATRFMLAYNLASAAAPSATTLANVTNALVGTAKGPIGQCYRICTLAAAPLALRYLGGTVGASSTSAFQLMDDIDGQIILAPGVALSVQCSSAADITASFTWEEEAF